MRLLLDTCTLLWYFEGSEKIPHAVRDILTDPVNEVLMSDASVLEIVLKYSLGKLELSSPPSALLPSMAEDHLIDELPLTPEAIYRLESLPWRHRDPFDRLLVAQALVHHLSIVTPDPAIRQYEASTLWA